MVEETLVFREQLMRFAKERSMFSLEDLALHLALDVIGKTVLYIPNKVQIITKS